MLPILWVYSENLQLGTHNLRLPRVAAEKGRHLVAIAADGHRAPAAAMRARMVVEKEAAGGIGTAANRRARALHEEFGGGAGDGGEKPFEPALARNEMEGPGTVARDEFVVAFGNAKDFVDGFHPRARERLPFHDRGEHGAQGLAQTKDAEKNGIDGERFRGGEGAEPGRTLFGNQPPIDKERDKFVPGEVVSRRSEIGEIKGGAASNEGHGRMEFRSHRNGDALTGEEC